MTWCAGNRLRRSALALSVAVSLLGALGSAAAASRRETDVSNADLERKFSQTVRPFLTDYCVVCHGGAKPVAQFDLRAYTTMASVVQDYPHWAQVLEKLTAK